MKIKEQFKNDKRFFVNENDIERIFNRKVKKYKICNIEISKIKKKINNRIITIYNTDSYKYLTNQINSDEYIKYCKDETFEYENHSIESFDKLVDDFKRYDLKDGAIVIDQFGLIRDGQHRVSILLKKYGKNYKIDVVKVYYSGFRIKTYIQLLMFWLKKLGDKKWKKNMT